MEQILYHGGSAIIRTPEIREPERSLDFGKGFYLTTSKSQAEQWVKNRLRKKGDVGYVNSYSFDLEKAKTRLRIKIFEAGNEECVDFVLANRMNRNFTHDFDVVIGPVADDKVYTQFSLFEGGIISKETLIKELKTYRLVDQFLFHTEKALPHLNYISNYPIKNESDNS